MREVHGWDCALFSRLGPWVGTKVGPILRPGGIPNDRPSGHQIRHHRRRHSRAQHRLSSGPEAEGDRQRLGRGHPHRRQDRGRGRRLGHRLRRGAQQLFPAGHARADGPLGRGVGERPQGLQLSSGRLHADQPRMHARRCRLDLRAAAGDRLRVGVHRRRRGLNQIYEGPVRRLAGARHHLGAAREARRLRQQPGQHARARRQGRGRGRPHPARRRGGELRVRLQLRRGDRAQHQSRPDRLRDRGGRRRAVGQQDLEHAGAAEADHRQGQRQGAA